MEQEQKPRERSFIPELVPDWRPTRKQRLWVIRIVILFVVVLGVLTLISWPFGITLWKWVKILIVPAVIAGGGIWFSRHQQQRESKIAEQRAQDEALQAYLDRIGNLLLDKDSPLRQSKAGDEVNTLARARTLTVLRRLGPGRKRSVLDFLYEADLIKTSPHKTSPQRVIDLGSRDFEYSSADLSGADLRGADLRRADLSGMKIGANLSEADMRGADLRGANLTLATLRGADLRGAHLIGTQFTEANLSGAQLSGAYFQIPVDSTQQYAAELRAAGLPDEHIEQDVPGSTLQHANLEWADLSGVRGITNMDVEVHTPLLLNNTTMPNGQKYEDWRKSKGREVSGKNDRSS